jgi:hypothetical protein
MLLRGLSFVLFACSWIAPPIWYWIEATRRIAKTELPPKDHFFVAAGVMGESIGLWLLFSIVATFLNWVEYRERKPPRNFNRKTELIVVAAPLIIAACLVLVLMGMLIVNRIFFVS